MGPHRSTCLHVGLPVLVALLSAVGVLYTGEWALQVGSFKSVASSLQDAQLTVVVAILVCARRFVIGAPVPIPQSSIMRQHTSPLLNKAALL